MYLFIVRNKLNKIIFIYSKTKTISKTYSQNIEGHQYYWKNAKGDLIRVVETTCWPVMDDYDPYDKNTISFMAI